MKYKYDKLMTIYDILFDHFGPRGWWPAETRLEIIIGAILTQAIAWQNVEKALVSLKSAGLFSETGIISAPLDELASAIRPALYHHQKARKLVVMMNFIQTEYEGDYNHMFSEPLGTLRAKLLGLWGIGEETADSILLYAGNYPIFVVDNYTRRIFSRLGSVQENVSYHDMQAYMHRNLPEDVGLFNEFHALLVALGSKYCLKQRPACLSCPMGKICKNNAILQE